jgi:hypothetical protein
VNKEEETWYWRGVSLGLGVAVIIANENGGLLQRARVAIKDQQEKVDNRDRDCAADAGNREYQSWLVTISGDKEVESWSAPKLAAALEPIVPESRKRIQQ